MPLLLAHPRPDPQPLARPPRQTQESSSFAPGRAAGVAGSVYAVAMDERGALVAAGSTQATVRLVDARSGEKVMQLKGHSDNVRCDRARGRGASWARRAGQ